MADTEQKASPSAPAATIAIETPVDTPTKVADGPKAPIDAYEESSLSSVTGDDIEFIDQNHPGDDIGSPAPAASSAQVQEMGQKDQDLDQSQNQTQEQDQVEVQDQAQHPNNDNGVMRAGTMADKDIGDEDMDADMDLELGDDADMDVDVDGDIDGDTDNLVDNLEMASVFTKRKRSDTFKDADDEFDDNDGSTLQGDDQPDESSGSRRRHGNAGVKGVIVGYWRESTAPVKDEKHAVIAFIDIRDRLRTRIQPHKMNGDPIDLNQYPIPPGPGGSWTTFERVVFDSPLVGLDQFQVKEFVKIRTDASVEESPQQKMIADKQAIKSAIRRVAVHPPPDTPANASPAIAHGVQIPDYLLKQDDQKKKKRKIGPGPAFGSPGMTIAPNPGALAHPSAYPVTTPPTQMMPHQPIQPQPQGPGPQPIAHQHKLPTTNFNNLPGGRPTRILVGTWLNSSEETRSDRHAVYGILGVNDMFRVKVVRETRDGRFMNGNFPSGAGALWITYDQVELDDNIKDLTRAEVKEYVRFRQYQIDILGDPDPNSQQSIREAVEQAKLRCASYDKHNKQEPQGFNYYGAGPSAPPGPGGPPPGPSGPGNLVAMGPMGPGSTPGQMQGTPPTNREMPPMGAFGTPASPETRTNMRPSGPLGLVGPGGILQAPPGSGVQTPIHPSAMAHIAPAPLMDPSGKIIEAPPVKIDGRTKAGRLARAQAAAAATARREAEAQAAMGARPLEPRPSTRSQRSSADAIERTNQLAQREVARAEAAAVRTERHEAGRTSSSAASRVDPNIERLDKVWQSQEANRLNRYQSEDAKFHGGIKYERKSTGPFAGKLVSHPVILSIDGEDFVEYRVLMKPSFD